MTILNDWKTELLDAISSFVCILEKNRIVYINATGVQMIGAKTSKDVINHALAEFVHDDYAELIETEFPIFAEEQDGIPIKLKPICTTPINVKMYVRTLSNTGHNPIFMVECRDISNYIRASEEARRREQRLAGVLNTVVDAIITIDKRGTILTASASTLNMFGYDNADIVGNNIKMLMPDEDANEHDHHISNTDKNGRFSILGKARELRGKTKNGRTFPIEIAVTKFFEDGEQMYTGIIRDITERKKTQAHIEHLAHHDTLTGLPNRNLFNDLMNRSIFRAQRARHTMALMFVDLDKFKPINDDLGHEAGDIVLKAVATCMTNHVRTSDTVARIGGDEFVIILDKIDHWENAAKVAKNIIQAIQKPIPVPKNKRARIGASVGISIFPDDGTTAAALIRAADEAMYAVKAQGRNNFQFYKLIKSVE